MALPSTHFNWMLYLAKKLDRSAPRARFLRRYVDGHAPLPEMNEATREAWKDFQRRARGNYGWLIVSALANRMVPIGVTVDGQSAPTYGEDASESQLSAFGQPGVEGGDEAPALPGEASSPQAAADREVARRARKLWEDTMFGTMITDAVTEACTVGTGYVLLEQDNEGPVVSVPKAENFYAEPDKLRPWRTQAAIQTWRDEEEHTDYARVWWNGERRDYRRYNKLRRQVLSEDWIPIVGSRVVYEGKPPAYILRNRDGFGEFERHVDVINRTNYSVLSRLVTMAHQAFTQRAIKGQLPETDQDGNAIDWSAAFSPHPGAIWNLPDADLDIWESKQTNLSPLLSAEDSDLRALSAASETPLASMVPDGANQTAEGAAFQKEAIVNKANDRIRRFSPVLQKVMERMLEIDGVQTTGVVEIQWEPTDRVSIAEKYDAAVKAKAAGESWQSIARNILGYSPEQIRQDAIDRANEQLTLQLMMPPVQENEADDSGDNLRTPGQNGRG